MLEGLEISEIPFESLERTLRIDAEFYKKENLIVVNVIQKLNAEPLTYFFDVSDGNHMSISESFCNIGIPYYRGQDIKNYFIENSEPICITKEAFDIPYMKRSHLQKGDVLLSIVGSIGGVSLVNSSAPATCSCKLAILRPKDKTNSNFLSVFLISKYGQNQICKYIRGAVQMGLILEDMDQLFIPNAFVYLPDIISDIINKIKFLQKRSVEMYSEAEGILLEELGLKDWKPKQEAVSVKSFADFTASGRLDAEYYQPKYDEIEAKIKAYKKGYDTIENCFGIKDINYIPDNNADYQYIELSNIGSNGEIIGCTSEKGVDLPSRARRIVNSSDIIVSSVEGSLQSCAIVTPEYNRALCSTGFYILEPQKINSQTSLLLFKSYPIQQLMKKVCSGTILTAMNKDEFLSIPIPIISKEIQTEIAEKLQESFTLKAESKRLLNLAKTVVETAIEHGEAQAMQLLMN